MTLLVQSAISGVSELAVCETLLSPVVVSGQLSVSELSEMLYNNKLKLDINP